MEKIVLVAQKINRFSLWIVLATVPLLLFPGGPLPYLCILVYGLIWISRKISSGRFSAPTNLDLPILILILTLIMGYSISIDPEMSWARMWNYILGVVLFYTFVNTLKPAVHWQIIVIMIALLATGIVLFSLVGTDWSNVRLFQIPWLYERFPSLIANVPGSGVPRESEFINPRAIGIALGFLLPFLICFLFFYSSGKFKLILGITTLLAFGGLLMTQTMQGLSGLMAALIFIAIWRTRKSVLWVFLGIGLCSVMFLAVGAQKSLVYLLSADNPVGIAVVLRLDMWSRALAMIRDMPFTGIGLNIFSVVQSNFYPGYLIGPEPHAHNVFLQTALDQGIPGLSAMLFMFLAWGITIKRNYAKIELTSVRVLYIAITAAIISYLVAGLADGMTLGAKLAPVIWTFIAIGAAPVGTPFIHQTGSRIRQVPWLRGILPIAFIGSIIGLVFYMNPGAIYSNLGSLIAQQSLYRINPGDTSTRGQLEIARNYSLQAAELNPDPSHLFQTTGRLESWLGDYPAAVAQYSQAVELDARDPYTEYFPTTYLLRLIQASQNTTPAWKDLLGIYFNWAERYPMRAEGYMLSSIVLAQQKHDLKGAETYINKGLERKAKPRELLLFYLGKLKNSTP